MISILERFNISTKLKLYHISEEDLDNKLLTPRIPKNYMTKNNYENNTIPRISFSTSIDGCLMGMSQNLKDTIFNVYEPEDYNDLKIISNKDIIKNNYTPDAKLTNEVWVITPVKLKFVCKIKVLKAINKSLQYDYGNKTANLYNWKWKVI